MESIVAQGQKTAGGLRLPRFDSPSVLGALLDQERGRRFRIAPVAADYVSRQLHLPDSAALILRFLTAGGVGEVVDFMPVAGSQPVEDHRLVRMARAVHSEMWFVVECLPRFDYGRGEHTLDTDKDGAIFLAGATQPTLHPGLLVDWHDQDVRVRQPHGDRIRARTTLQAGDVGAVMLHAGPDVRPHRLERSEPLRMFNDTVAFWRRWLGRSTYSARWREQVLRSAMTLKLMTCAPSGALLAAQTTGLPEQAGRRAELGHRRTRPSRRRNGHQHSARTP